MVQGNIQDLCRGRTTIVVAHRLSTIKRADEILVLSSGSVVERGSHEQLLNADGEYAALWKLQSSSGVPDKKVEDIENAQPLA